ncbi:hypothetical protein [Scytonema sp. NUACC26]|uniref:hypothetical protein n=1 Tax=Scytonema sp. NUACC26 TaxID=3140176 RepID=UPI0034DC83A6
MKLLRNIWTDISQGENIDLYLTILAAIALVTMNILGDKAQSKIAPFTVAVLALLTIATIGNRHRLDKIIKNLNDPKDDYFLTDFSLDTQKEINNHIINCKNLLVLGVTLGKTQQLLFPLFEKRLQKGENLRIVLIAPKSSACEISANAKYAPINVDSLKLQIQYTLDSLMKMQINKKGMLEIRLINFPLAHGGILVDSDTPIGTFYLWYYGYKTRQANRPKFIVRPVDGYWYEYFQEEANAIWDSATPYIP